MIFRHKILIITACIVVYYNSIYGKFVNLDDFAIRDFTLISNPSSYWYSITSFTYYLSHKLFGYWLVGWHWISIILHIIASLLVYKLARLFLKSNSALLAGLIFAVHPLHTECVTWISGRQYILVAIFALSSFFLYKRALWYKNINWLYLILSMLIFTYGCKYGHTSLILLPIFIFIMDIFFLRHRISFCIIYFAIAFIGITMNLDVLKHRLEYNFGLPIESVLLQIEDMENASANFKYSMVQHFKTFFNVGMITFYHQPILIVLDNLKTELELLYQLFFAHFGLTIFFKRIGIFLKFWFSLLCYCVFLGLTFLPPQLQLSSIWADRYMYLPSAFLCIALLLLVDNFYGKTKLVLYFFTIVWIGYLGYTTINLNKNYHSCRKFWEETVNKSNRSYRAHNNLGLEYYKLGRYSEALNEFKRAFYYNRVEGEATNNLRALYQRVKFNRERIGIFY